MFILKKNKSEFKMECKTLTTVGIGIALGQLSQILMSAIDVYMISILGEKFLAGEALVSSLNLLAYLFCMGLVMVIPPLVGEAKGENNNRRVSDLMKNGYLISIGAALVQVLYLIIIPWIVRFIIHDSAVVNVSYMYAYGLIPGIIPWTIFMFIRLILATYGDVKFSSIISLLGVVINFFGNYLLIYDNKFFHGLGVVGCALSTSITNILQLLAIFLYVKYAYNKEISKYMLAKGGTISKKIIYKIINLGIPSGFTFFSEQFIFTATSLLIGRLSSTSLAAYNVVIQWLNIFYMFPIGIANSASMRVGETIGEKNKAKNKIVIKSAFTLFLVYAVIIVGLIIIKNHSLIYMIIDNSYKNMSVIELASNYMYWIAIIFVINSIIAIIAGILRGFKETKAPLVLVLLLYWIFGVGSSLIFSILLQENGVFIGIVLGLTLTLVGMCVVLKNNIRKTYSTMEEVDL
ncbi:MATE family efflux transporter [Clostridium botulinum]|uniref:Probable multidrug resistance protein NorM n=1 Tax=Clostridium botulinum TaxID=1491 RepID=A0A846I5I5_CLOBO|nr:MATE family efflux transporter [Clostridium botulinum]